MAELLQQIRKLIWYFHEKKTVSKVNFNDVVYVDLRLELNLLSSSKSYLESYLSLKDSVIRAYHDYIISESNKILSNPDNMTSPNYTYKKLKFLLQRNWENIRNSMLSYVDKKESNTNLNQLLLKLNEFLNKNENPANLILIEIRQQLYPPLQINW